MNSARSHQKLTIISMAVSIGSVYFLSWDQFLAIQAGIAVTLVPEFTPDLDISHRQFGVLGQFIGLRAYAKSIPHRAGMRRRSWKPWNVMFLSHVPFLGTAFRTFLLILPLALLSLPFDWWDWARYIFWLWLGMSYSDCWHVAADKVTGDWKELNRRWWHARYRHVKKDGRFRAQN